MTSLQSLPVRCSGVFPGAPESGASRAWIAFSYVDAGPPHLFCSAMGKVQFSWVDLGPITGPFYGRAVFMNILAADFTGAFNPLLGGSQMILVSSNGANVSVSNNEDAFFGLVWRGIAPAGSTTDYRANPYVSVTDFGIKNVRKNIQIPVSFAPGFSPTDSTRDIQGIVIGGGVDAATGRFE